MASTEKKLKKSVKGIKSKTQLVQEIKHNEKIASMKKMASSIYPEIEKLETIYDGQTVVNALAGFISAHIEKKVIDIKLSDLDIDLSKEESSDIKKAILNLMDKFKDESAQVLSETLERFGQSLSQYSAHTFMKQPMNTIKIEDIIAK